MSYAFCPSARDTLLLNYVKKQNYSRDRYNTHVHRTYELLYVLEADATYIIEDRKYKLKAHDLIIVRPGNYHLLQFDSQQCYERYNILFDPVLLGIDNICVLPEHLDVLNCSQIPIITDLFRKMDYYHAQLTDKEMADMLVLLIKELIYNLSIHCTQRSSDRLHHSPPLLRDALKLINENLATIDNVGQIAQALFISESYLYRMFQKELLTTPSKYITEKRLLMAQELLRSGKNPTEVYSDCGFSDYSVFYRSYQKYFGYKPSEENRRFDKKSI